MNNRTGADSEGVTIRKFCPADRDAVRNISFKTAFLGYAQDFLDDREIVADALTLYFTDFEPQSLFVAVSAGVVIGYLTGALDFNTVNRTLSSRIYPVLLWRAVWQGAFFHGKSLRLFFHCFVSFLKGEFRSPDFTKEYPAILHINIDHSFRNKRVGERLIEAYLDYLKDKGVKGVHLATMSSDARRFFEKMSFLKLYEARRSYLRYFLKKDVPYFILGRSLL